MASFTGSVSPAGVLVLCRWPMTGASESWRLVPWASSTPHTMSTVGFMNGPAVPEKGKATMPIYGIYQSPLGQSYEEESIPWARRVSLKRKLWETASVSASRTSWLNTHEGVTQTGMVLGRPELVSSCIWRVTSVTISQISLCCRGSKLFSYNSKIQSSLLTLIAILISKVLKKQLG